MGYTQVMKRLPTGGDTMTIAERVADKYVAGLDMSHLAKLDIWLLHAIKAVAVKEWARQTLVDLRAA